MVWHFLLILSFFLIFSFSFKWQTKNESLIFTQKNMSIWEMVRNKTPLELFAFEAPFMHSFRVSTTVTRAATSNFVFGSTKTQCFWFCRYLHVYVCLYLCTYVHLSTCVTHKPPTHALFFLLGWGKPTFQMLGRYFGIEMCNTCTGQNKICK